METPTTRTNNNAAAKSVYSEAWLYYLTGKFTMIELADVLGINHTTLQTYAARNEWFKKRKAIHDKAGSGLTKKLEERIEQARIKHQNFMIGQLEETSEAIGQMKVGENDPFHTPTDNKPFKKVLVNDKLDLLEKQQRVATPVLKLEDDRKEDNNAFGFQFLLAMQQGGGVKQIEPKSEFEDMGFGEVIDVETTLSAMDVLPANSEAPLGIIRSNNAHCDGGESVEKVVYIEIAGERVRIEGEELGIKEATSGKPQRTLTFK